MSTLTENIVENSHLPGLDIPKVVPSKSEISLYMAFFPVMTALYNACMIGMDGQLWNTLSIPVQGRRNEAADKLVGL